MCWRRNLDSMQKRMVAVMSNNIPDICHDVTFLVGQDEVEISCHKIFLTIASPVFQAMFSHRHNSQETPANGLPNECTTIKVSDVQPNGLKSLIKYAYTGILNVDVDDLTATMYAAHKYDIPELTQYCSQILYPNLSEDNAVTAYQAALLLNDENLERNSWEFIETNSGALLDSDQFLEFSGENLRKFLGLDFMPFLNSEVDVFNALMRWGTFECDQRDLQNTEENLRSVLETRLSLIRFPTMEVDDFNEIVVPSGVLSFQECIKLLTYFTSSGEKRKSIGATLQYSCTSRVDGKYVLICETIHETLEIEPKENISYDDFTITGITTEVKLKSVGIVLPSLQQQSGESVSVCLYGQFHKRIGIRIIAEWRLLGTATNTVSKALKICYLEFESPGAKLPADKRVDVVKYSKELINESAFTWETVDKQQLKLAFTPHSYVIWALHFVN